MHVASFTSLAVKGKANQCMDADKVNLHSIAQKGFV